MSAASQGQEKSLDFWKDASYNNPFVNGESLEQVCGNDNIDDDYLEETDEFDVDSNKEKSGKSWKLNPPNSLLPEITNRYKKNSVNQSRANKRILPSTRNWCR